MVQDFLQDSPEDVCLLVDADGSVIHTDYDEATQSAHNSIGSRAPARAGPLECVALTVLSLMHCGPHHG